MAATLHNLAYLARLMAGLRSAIARGTLPAHDAALRGGAALPDRCQRRTDLRYPKGS